MKTATKTRKSFLGLLSDFPAPHFFSDPFALANHSYTKKEQDDYQFVHHFLCHSKQKALYKSLEALFHQSFDQLEKLKLSGEVEMDMHPLDEQKWFVSHLETKVDHFSPEEIWLIMLQHEEREKYVCYFSHSEEIDAFELFLQNYLFSALNQNQLLKVIFLIQNTPLEDQSLFFQKFFYCISVSQSRAIFNQLKSIQMPYSNWRSLCLDCMACMRNAQLLSSMTFFPSEVATRALVKLYPSEVVSFISEETDKEKKKHFIEKTLGSYRLWWQSFCQEEVRCALLELEKQDS